MNYYIKCIGEYTRFSGRATRREFWGFTLTNAVILLIILLAHAKFQTGMPHTVLTYTLILYAIFSLSPFLAVTSRRWRDIGRTGFWTLLYLIPIVGMIVSWCFLLGKGDSRTNKYGRNPREKNTRRASR